MRLNLFFVFSFEGRKATEQEPAVWSQWTLGSFTFGSWQNLDFCFILYRKHKELWGANVTSFICFIIYFFFPLVSFLHFQRWKCYFFTVLFGTFLNLMLLYGCILHHGCLPHLGSELSKCFQNKQFINFSLAFLNLVCFVFLVSPVICVAWLQGEIKRDFLPIVSLSIEIS